MASIDSLSIQITASTASAKTKVEALTKALNELGASINALDVSKFETLANAMGSLSSGLAGLKGAGVKQIEKVGKAINSVNEAAQKDTLDTVAKDVQKVADKSKEASGSLGEVGASFGKFDTSSLETINQTMAKVSNTVQKTSNEMGAFKSLLAKTKIIIPTEGLEKVDKRIEKLNERIEDLKDRLNFKSETQAGYVDSKEMDKDKEKIAGLINELDRLKLKKQELESHGGFKLNLGGTIENLKKGFDSVNQKISSFISNMRKAHTRTKDTSKSTKDFSLASMKLAKELTRVTKMLKLMITRMVLRKMIQGVIDGFKNLTQYSSEVDASVSLMWNSFRQLGNSIAAAVGPIINALAPALNYIIQLCIKVANAINQVISSLTGRSTWTRAKTLTDDYAKSLDKSNKSAKDLKRTILGFDEINQLQDNKDSGGGGLTKPEDMFEDAKIEAKWADLAQKLRSILNQLLAPIKKAWANIGDQVVAAWTRAFKSVKKLLSDIGRDFLKVWNQPETVAMLENILRIFRDIGSIIALLAEGLDKAWNKNKTGLRILEAIRDIFAIVIQHVKNMTSATVLWAKELDFTPILTAFKDWVISMKPVVDAIAGAFEDFYRKVLLPLGKWTLEKGLPDLIQVFIDFNNKVEWDTIRERLNRVWEALEPFAEAVGEGLVKFIGGVADKIAGFLNSDGWESFIDTLVEWTNSIDADKVARGLEKIFEALVAYKTVSTLTTIVNYVRELVKTSSTGIVIAVKVAIAFAIAQGVFNTFLKFFQWLVKVSMEDNGYTKVDIDIEMAFWTKLREEYGGMGGIGHMLMDLIMGDHKDKVQQWKAEAVVETYGIHEAEVQVEDLRQKTEDLGNSQGLQMFVEKANGSVEELKNLDAISFDSVKSSVEDVGKAVGELAISVEKDTDAISKSTDKIKFKPASDEASSFAKDIGKAFDDLKISVEKDTSSIKKSTDNISFKPLSDAASDLQTHVTEAFGEVDKSVENTDDVMTDNFDTISRTVSDGSTEILKATDTIKDAFSEDKWTFDGVANGLGTTFRKAKEAIKKEWNEIANTLNGEHQVGAGSMKINLPKFYAKGGFPDPEDGWFRASHGEMLGKFDNGQSVVANNEQITNGIANAVYSAIVSANSGNSNSRYINNTIMIDGRAIARAVTIGQEDMDRRYSPVTT